MIQKEDTEIFYPMDLTAWRAWLEKNHQSKSSVWLVLYNKSSGKPSISWSEAVDVALCFGWIDSKKIKIDPERSHQFFSKRKAKSTWSKINKDKVERLIASGLMTQAGLECIEKAKQNGSWRILDEVEALKIPADLEAAFMIHTGAKSFFEGLSKSARKAMLQWLVLAKRPETRQERVHQIAALASKGMKPKPF